MLTDGNVVKVSPLPCSPFNDAYGKRLANVFNMNRTRILAFKNKPPPSVDCFQDHLSTAPEPQPAKSRGCIPQSAERVLDAPEIVDDYYLNLLDWGSNNILAIGLGNSVYLCDASNGSTRELLGTDDELGPVTSVRWAPDGKHIAVGLDNSNIQLWDSVAIRLSPDGYTVASAAADETLRIWNVFGTPDLTKPAPEPKSMPFTHLAHIR